MVDSQENILVEFDYNNIVVIDPNKVIDEDGKAKERFVKQENLVMYANLECKVLPRTKLALGVSSDDQLQTISVASMNFLNPGGKEFLENNYTDEITGKDSLKGKGVNQPNQKLIRNPDKSDDYYLRQTFTSGGNPGMVDNGLLGITQISINLDLSFTPTIEIELEDIKGRALFESGDNSPYAAFFNMPYPLFYLTIKGFYGKAIRLPLMMRDFQARYDSGNGNFKVSLRFYTYKFTSLREISMGHLEAVPHMYRSKLLVQDKSGGPSNNTKVNESSVELGYQKIREMYSEYKSKGLIPEDFPEITVVQLQKRIENFIKNVLDSFTKQNLDPINNCNEYIRNLNDYRTEVYYGLNTSWFYTNMDVKNYYIYNVGDKKIKIYNFQKNITNEDNSLAELNKIITNYNKKFNDNETVGTNGKYVIENTLTGKPTEIKKNIPINIISPDNFILKNFNVNDIDWTETYREVKGVTLQPNDILIEQFKTEQITNNFIGKKFFYFEGINTAYIEDTDRMGKDLKAIREEIETKLTEELNSILTNTNNGIGFVPTIRNVLAVIFASGEAFLRLMDLVHRKAWDINNSSDGTLLKIRRDAILSPETSNACVDNTDSGVDKLTPIYPWPQFIVKTTGDDNQELYEIQYPGDPKYINKTKGFVNEAWPEIEFLEEFLRGFTARGLPPSDPNVYTNEINDVQRITFNAIEFPSTNTIYENKEEVKYFFEILERILLYSDYSKLSRLKSIQNFSGMIDFLSECELVNVLTSLGTDNPFLIQKIKNYKFDGDNYLTILKHFSNSGVGESWQNYIRGIFNTPYIDNIVKNSEFEFLTSSRINNSATQPLVSVKNIDLLSQYLTGSTEHNEFDFTDTYPFVLNGWCSNNLANGVSTSNVFSTSKIIGLNDTNKSITNYTNTDTITNKRPVTSFNYLNSFNINSFFNDETGMINFYRERENKPFSQVPTEGNLRYFNYSGNVSPNQTVSMLNTPYFVNSISDGVKKFQNFEEYPFVSSAYLFLNSLPLSTLKEKYKSYDTNNDSTTDLDYIFATLKKFGAIHKVPYAWILKIGSVYHRYKKFVETGVDILSNSWSGFSYVNSYDPQTNSPTKTYRLTIDDSNIDIVLEQNVSIGGDLSTLINTGFYPKTINDFNLFYQGYDIINPYFTLTGTCSILDDVLTVNSINSDELVNGYKLEGGTILSDTEIVSQISGTVGGVGTYRINKSQRYIGNFIITNNTSIGYSENDIQVSFKSGLTLNYVKSAIINQPDGFDPNDKKRDLRIIPWTTYVNTIDGLYSFVLPSNGSLTNQTLYECFKKSPTGYTMTQEVSGNQSVFDGSVRLFWSAPNYGYFDNSRVSLPTPKESVKVIFSGREQQDNFSIDGVNDYTDISEIFSVFERGVLDQFENLFLNFSKSIYDYDDSVLSGETSVTEISFKNFQMFFRSLMKIPKQSGNTTEEIISKISDEQLKTVTGNIQKFLEYDIYFKYGNPSFYDRRIFQSFSSTNIVDPYTFNPYKVETPNALPPQVSLVSSKNAYPETWKALETYVGFSNIPELSYKDSGSFITDFFIDLNIAFNKNNVINLAPIIRIYATQKLLSGTSDYNSFVNAMDEYILKNENVQNNVITNLFIKLNTKLPNVSNVNENQKPSILDGSQNKVELWENFKTINDRWIAGGDFTNKTLFEDVLLLDRASRNIGDSVLVDVFKLRDRLMTIPSQASMGAFIETIIMENNFVVMNVPAYINFYNVQNATKNPVPKPDGTTDLANSLFGTFMNVDYRDSSTKMVCFYAGKPSEHLDIKSVDYRFRSDAFDLRRASDNPLLEKLTDKNDWDKSNKVVGFNVDIGTQNQSIFNGFFVDQRAGTNTVEGLQILNQMANLGGNRGGTTQNLSLYSLYKNRSYNCTITMMGNAMIQPTMYFNLRYVPMFSGPYMILTVKHSIAPGFFETTVTGVRQPLPNLDKSTDYLQSLRVNLLQRIQEEITQEKDLKNKKTNDNQSNVINQTKNAVQSLKSPNINTESQSQSCSATTRYSKYVYTTPISVQYNIGDIVRKIRVKTDNETLRQTIFSKLYLNSQKRDLFQTKSNNLAAISLDVDADGNNMNWGDSDKFFEKKYYCSTDNVPYVFFKDLDTQITFLVERWKQKIGGVKPDDENDILKFLILNQTSVTAKDNVYTSINQTELTDLLYYVVEGLRKYKSVP